MDFDNYVAGFTAGKKKARWEIIQVLVGSFLLYELVDVLLTILKLMAKQ